MVILGFFRKQKMKLEESGFIATPEERAERRVRVAEGRRETRRQVLEKKITVSRKEALDKVRQRSATRTPMSFASGIGQATRQLGTGLRQTGAARRTRRKKKKRKGGRRSIRRRSGGRRLSDVSRGVPDLRL